MTEIARLENRFSRVQVLLSKETWFRKERWIASSHAFPEKKPTGVTLHVFKKHWFNEQGRGIHIESFLDADKAKQRKTYLTLHLLHEPLVPGTTIKRGVLAKLFVDRIYDEVSGWPGYKFRTGRYGQQPFVRFLDATNESFEQELLREIAALGTRLGPVLDESLASLVG